MAKTVFGQAEIDAWSAALTERRPPTIEEIEWPEMRQVDAFAPMPLTQGMAIRMAMRDRGTIEFLLSPVAALRLAACILQMGMEAGWLSESADVICPPVPRLDG